MKVAAWCNALLALHPDDPELIGAHAHLRGRGFLPPPPRELPTGAPAGVRARLERRSTEDLAELAAALVALPEPAQEPALAAAALELLLIVPGEQDRARRLLDAIEHVGASAGDALGWRFRLGAGGIGPRDGADAGAWEALLAPARAATAASASTDATAREALAAALRLASARWLAAKATGDMLGADWLVPVLHGRRVANAALARQRRPTLAAPDLLGPAFAWLDEAASLAPSGAGDGPEALVALADAADRRGEVDLGSRLLRQAAAAAADGDGLDAALAARAALLVDPTLGPEVAAAQSALARRAVPAIAATPPEPPRRDWTRLIAAAPADALDPSSLALLEAAGSRARAARAWLARGDRASLLQAARLADALSAEERERLTAALAAASGDDELSYATDPEARDLAIARWWQLAPGLERRMLYARLATLLPEPRAASEPTADDPHSVESRLAAAADLLGAGRIDASVAVLTALLRRAEGDAPLARLGAICARALEHDPAPLELVEAADRQLRAGGEVGRALLAALAANPAGAYALHELLLQLGADVSRADAYRVAALEAWLGIWCATGTPPDELAVAALARGDAALAAIAAARLARSPDPVAAARAHLERHATPSDDDGAARAADLLAMATAS